MPYEQVVLFPELATPPVEPEQTLVCWPGFESALVGVVERCGLDPVACYDYQTMLDILMQRDGMAMEAAREFVEYNCAGQHVGPYTPFVLHRLLRAEAQ